MSEAGAHSDLLKPKHSKALLDVEGIRQKSKSFIYFLSSNKRFVLILIQNVLHITFVAKESVVFSLLKEKKRSGGTFKIAPSPSLQKVNKRVEWIWCQSQNLHSMNL